MGKTTKYKNQLLQESELELLLKSYLIKMEKFMGEEFTILTLSSDNDIVESLNHFTSKFEQYENNDLAFVLLRSAVLSNEQNYYIQVIKNKISIGELQDSLDLVNENLGFRKSLTRSLLNNGKKTDTEIYNLSSDKENTLRSLDTLSFYEQIVNEKKKENRIIKVVTRK